MTNRIAGNSGHGMMKGLIAPDEFYRVAYGFFLRGKDALQFI